MSVTFCTAVRHTLKGLSPNKAASPTLSSTDSTTTTKPVAAYVRAANWEAAQEKLAEQERYIRQWANLNGYRIVEVYADLGSGNSEDRPQLQRLLSDAQAGKYEAVIVADYARLFRNLSMLSCYLEILKDGLDVVVEIINAEGSDL